MGYVVCNGKGDESFSRRVGCSAPQDEVVDPSVWKLKLLFTFTDQGKARHYPALSQSASPKPYEDQDAFFCVQLGLLRN